MSIDPLVEEAEAGSEIYPHSTNISDYIFPSAIQGSSEFGKNTVMRINQNNTPNADRRAKPLGFTLSDSAWVADFDFILNSRTIADNSPCVALCDTANGDVNSGVVDMVAVFFNGIGLNVQMGFKDGAGARTLGGAITIAQSVQYYLRFERTSTINIRLSVFSNQARTNHIAGSPTNLAIPATIISLAHLSHWAGSIDSSNAGQIHQCDIDNTVIGAFSENYETDVGWDASLNGRETFVVVTPSPFPATNAIDNNTVTYWQSDNLLNQWLRGEFSAIADKEPSAIAIFVDKSKMTVTQFLIQTSVDGVAWTLKRTINITQLTDLAYNFIRFNRDVLPIRYIRLIGNDVTAKQFAINEYRALIPTATQWLERQTHKTISPTSTSIGLAG